MHVSIYLFDYILINFWALPDFIITQSPCVFSSGHYTGTSTTDQAQNCGKPLWSSEDVSSYDDETGGGCLARVSSN